jgi:selenocysteine-specific elongation factor
MIVATAGHIDHGKTTLVKALTGVDTDRLREEKERGISIDLGFAYWTEPQGSVLGFVDVPGHERFVRNMLAGVCAIDYALLVVAADDGVMPQTREHLNIVDLLGISHGLAVITKSDRADAARVAEVEEEVRALTEGTSLEGVKTLAVSAAAGTGISELRDVLAQAARRHTREATSGRRLRFAVDRAFTVQGSGTVVTGTVFDGSVKPGDRLVVSPAGHEVRVRAIQKHGTKDERAQAGERCALNLVGIELSQVHRGDWVLDAHAHAPTSRIDVELQVLPGEAQPLAHWTPVHLHLGTRDVTARVSIRRGESIAAGGKGFARLIADQPLVAAHGDRFILRDQSAQRTVGGGRVLDAAPSHKRIPRDVRLRQLEALAHEAPGDALKALVQAMPAGVPAQAFARNFDLDTQAFTDLLARSGLAMLGTGDDALVFTRETVAARTAKAAPSIEPVNPEHVRLWRIAELALKRAGRGGITVAQLAQDLRAKEPVLRDMLYRKAKAGDAVRVTDDRFYARATIDEFIVIARKVADSQPDHRFTAAKFRDQAGVGRALAIEVLEAMDRLGATQRLGDVRIMRAPLAATSTPSSAGAKPS